MSGSPPTSPPKVAAKAKPHAAFTADVIKNVDNVFQIIEPMEVIPGTESFYAPFVVKVDRVLLNLGHVLPVFIESGDPGMFEFVELVGIGVVIETSPLCFQFTLMDDTDTRVAYPKLMTLESVSKVFVFNNMGIARIAKAHGTTTTGLVAFLVPPAMTAPVFTASPLTKGLPALPSISDGGFKARTNAMKCQNIKVLFHKDAAAFLGFAGPMEDIAGEYVISAVQSRVPPEFLDLIILQPKRIKDFVRLMFQLVEGGDGLHLKAFRKPSVIVTSTFHLKRCFENFTEVLKAVVGGDADGFLFNVFFQILSQLNSSASGCLCSMITEVLEHELSSRLVAFSLVLSSATALTDSDEDLCFQLKIALAIDMKALEKKNFRRLGSNLTFLTAQMAKGALVAGAKRKQDWDVIQAGKKGASDGGGSPRGLGAPGKLLNYCLADVSFAYLGGVVLDDKPPLAKCSNVGCRFDHDIPVAPVSKEQKARLLSVIKLVAKSPQRLEALTKVVNKPNFSV